jgi:hypothetical protein
MRKTLAFVALVTSLAFGSGCAYTAMAIAPDGTLYVAKNVLSISNTIFACKPNGATLTCTPAGSP